jgi:hypothetical protein
MQIQRKAQNKIIELKYKLKFQRCAQRRPQNLLIVIDVNTVGGVCLTDYLTMSLMTSCL